MFEWASSEILRMDTQEFWFWVAGLCVVLTVLFVLQWRYLRRARIIEDTPTATIRSAPQGYVELEGTGSLMAGMPIKAPLTGKYCLWYKYIIEKRTRSYTSQRIARSMWQTIDSRTSGELFMLKDASGECIVDPEGAEVTCGEKDVWYGSNDWPDRGPAISGYTGRYRYTEYRLMPGPVYLLGRFRTVSGNDTTVNDEVTVILRRWKSDRSSLLQQFDTNLDGKIDMEEWEAAREKALRYVLQERARESGNPAVNMVVMPETDRQPYLISAYPQTRLVQRYRRRALLSFAGSFISLGGLLYLLAVRLSQ